MRRDGGGGLTRGSLVRHEKKHPSLLGLGTAPPDTRSRTSVRSDASTAFSVRGSRSRGIPQDVARVSDDFGHRERRDALAAKREKRTALDPDTIESTRTPRRSHKSIHVNHHGRLDRYENAGDKILGLKHAIGYLFRTIEVNEQPHNPAFPNGFGVEARSGDICRIDQGDEGFLATFDGAVDDVKKNLVRHRIIKRLKAAIPGLEFEEIPDSSPMQFRIAGLDREIVLESMASFNRTKGQALFIAEFLRSMLREVAATSAIGNGAISVEYGEGEERPGLRVVLDESKISSDLLKDQFGKEKPLAKLLKLVFNSAFINNINAALLGDNAEFDIKNLLQMADSRYNGFLRDVRLKKLKGSDLHRIYEYDRIGDSVADMYAMCSEGDSQDIREHIMKSLHGSSNVTTERLPTDLFSMDIDLSRSKVDEATINFWMRLVRKNWITPWDGNRKSVSQDEEIYGFNSSQERTNKKVHFVSGNRDLPRTAKNFEANIFNQGNLGHMQRARLLHEIKVWLRERLGMEGAKVAVEEAKRASDGAVRRGTFVIPGLRVDSDDLDSVPAAAPAADVLDREELEDLRRCNAALEAKNADFLAAANALQSQLNDLRAELRARDARGAAAEIAAEEFDRLRSKNAELVDKQADFDRAKEELASVRKELAAARTRLQAAEIGAKAAVDGKGDAERAIAAANARADAAVADAERAIAAANARADAAIADAQRRAEEAERRAEEQIAAMQRAADAAKQAAEKAAEDAARDRGDAERAIAAANKRADAAIADAQRRAEEAERRAQAERDALASAGGDAAAAIADAQRRAEEQIVAMQRELDAADAAKQAAERDAAAAIADAQKRAEEANARVEAALQEKRLGQEDAVKALARKDAAVADANARAEAARRSQADAERRAADAEAGAGGPAADKGRDAYAAKKDDSGVWITVSDKDNDYLRIFRELLGSKGIGLNAEGALTGKIYHETFGDLHMKNLNFGKIQLFNTSFRNCVFENVDFSGIGAANFNSLNFPGCVMINCKVPLYSSITAEGAEVTDGDNCKIVNIDCKKVVKEAKPVDWRVQGEDVPGIDPLSAFDRLTGAPGFTRSAVGKPDAVQVARDRFARSEVKYP